jgi:hypothetical protein
MTTRRQTDPATYALRSLVGIEALALLTSVHHLDQLGVSFLLPAVLIVGLPPILMWWFLKQPSHAARLSYGTLVALIILVFGLQDGFWNHTVKMTSFSYAAPIEPRWPGCRSPRSARCSMRSPACSPLLQRSSPPISVINSSPRPASWHPRRSGSARSGNDWFLSCDAEEWQDSSGVTGVAAQPAAEVAAAAGVQDADGQVAQAGHGPRR